MSCGQEAYLRSQTGRLGGPRSKVVGHEGSQLRLVAAFTTATSTSRTQDLSPITPRGASHHPAFNIGCPPITPMLAAAALDRLLHHTLSTCRKAVHISSSGQSSARGAAWPEAQPDISSPPTGFPIVRGRDL